jgi:hypothetical protein
MFFSDSFFGNTYKTQAALRGKEISALTDLVWSKRREILTLTGIKKTTQYEDVRKLFKPDYCFLLDEAIK